MDGTQFYYSAHRPIYTLFLPQPFLSHSRIIAYVNFESEFSGGGAVASGGAVISLEEIHSLFVIGRLGLVIIAIAGTVEIHRELDSGGIHAVAPVVGEGIDNCWFVLK